MIKPFEKDFPLTQGFGENPAMYAQFGMKGHNGLDYGVPNNTQIRAPHYGKVIEVAFDKTGYGLYIKIENDKEGSVLAHLKENYVAVGATVSEGQLIAASDNTGNSTGPHLHWGVYPIPRNRQNGYAGFIDQLPLLTPQVPLEDIAKLKAKIADLEATEKNLKKQLETVSREKDTLLAEREVYLLNKLKDYKNRLIQVPF